MLLIPAMYVVGRWALVWLLKIKSANTNYQLLQTDVQILKLRFENMKYVYRSYKINIKCNKFHNVECHSKYIYQAKYKTKKNIAVIINARSCYYETIITFGIFGWVKSSALPEVQCIINPTTGSTTDNSLLCREVIQTITDE